MGRQHKTDDLRFVASADKPPRWHAPLAFAYRPSFRERLLGTTALVGFVVVGGMTGSALANPTGGNVVAGSAAISQPSSAVTEIHQQSDRAIIDWQSFSIDRGQRTQFFQPSASSFTLNRVTGGDPSRIAGQLKANGNIALVNRSGIVFANGSQVDVNALIATTADIRNENFMAGKMNFNIPSANPNATVTNDGQITIADHGFAALVAPGVANSGVIQAKLGKVVLAGAETFAVDLYGDGLISFDVGSKVAQVPASVDGKPVTALVSNTGQISADGGTILLTADAVDNILTDLVHAGGSLQAQSVGAQTGAVLVDGGTAAGGTVLASGTLDASGLGAGQTGGTIEVLGDRVGVTSGATIDATGDAGGGAVFVGGNFHGAGPQQNATMTVVEKGATIDASAVSKGDGGKVAVWSQRATGVYGAITARGGTSGGKGGMIETSSKGYLDVAGATIDAGAPLGAAGTWLLDPTSVTIDATTTTATLTLTKGVFSDDGTDATAHLNVSDITTALNSKAPTDVIVTTSSSNATGTGTISVNADITWTTGSAFGLLANSDITLGANISGTSGALILQSVNGAITQAATKTINVATLSMIAANGIGLTGAPINVAPSGAMRLTAMNTGSSGGIFVSGSTANAINVSQVPLPTGSATSPDFTVFFTQPTAGITAAGGDFTVQNAGNIVLAQNVTASGGTLTLAATGTINQTGGAISATTLTGSSGAGGASLTGNTNAIANLGNFATTGGAFALTDNRSLAITGNLNAGAGTVTLNALGTATITENATTGKITAGSLTGSSAGGAVALNSATNAIASLGAFATHGGGFALTNGGPLAITGNLDAGAGTVAFNVTGALGETTGSITAGTLTGGSSGGPVALNSATNAIDNLGDFATGGGGFALTDSSALAIAGSLNAGAGTVTLTGLGAATTITENTATGKITAGALTGSAAGGDVALNSITNAIATLDAFATAGGSFALVDSSPLTLTGAVATGGGTLSLTIPGLTPTLTGSLSSGTGATTLTAPGGTALVAGAADGNAPGTPLLLSDALLGQITAGSLTLATTGTADIFLNGVTNHAGLNGVTLNSGRNVQVDPGGASFASSLTVNANNIAIAGNLTVGTTLTLAATGAITESFPFGAVTAGTLTGSSGAGGTNLTNFFANNFIANLGDFDTHGGAFALNDTGSLTITGKLNAGAGTVGLNGFGTITETTGSIVAGTLTGSSSGGAVTLNSNNNAIADLGAFSTSNGAFALTDSGPLTITGNLNAGAGTVTLTGLGAATITENTTTGQITAGTLSGATAGGAVALSSSTNAITNLGNLATNGGDFALANSSPLTVSGAVATSGGALSLTMPSLAVTGTLSSGTGTTTLTAPGGTALVAGAADGNAPGTPLLLSDALLGQITAGSLTLATTGTADIFLNGVTNHAGLNGVTLNSGRNVQVDPGGASFASSLTVNANNIAIAGNLTVGTTLTLAATGAITESFPFGAVTAGTLTGSSGAGGTNLTNFFANNFIANLGDFDTHGGAFALNDTGSLTITGKLNAGAGTVGLNGFGTITETTGSIVAGTLTGSSSGGAVTLNSNNNAIADLGAFSTSNGAFALTDSGPLTITGNLNAGAGTVTLAIAGTIDETTGSIATTGELTGSSAGTASFSNTNAISSLGAFATNGGAFALTDNISLNLTGHLNAGAGTVTLNGLGAIRETTGSITAGMLTGNSVGGAVTLANTANAITALGDFATNGGAFALTDSNPLALTGNLNAGAGTVALNGASALTQTGGIITASTLTGSSVGGASLTDANRVANLGPFANAASGDLSFTDALSLTVSGALSSAANLTLNTLGNLVLNNNLTAAGGTPATGTVALHASGTITQAAGVITADTLAGSSTGGVALDKGNRVANLGPFANAAGGTLSFNDAQNLRTSGALSTAGNLALQTSGNLALDSDLSAGLTMTLTAGGVIDQGTGVITAATLTGSSVGGANLRGANRVTSFGSFVNAGSGNLLFNDASVLTTTGSLSSAGNLTVIADLTLSGSLSAAGTMALISTDGPIITSGNVTLTAGNIVELGGSAFALGGTLTVNAPVLAILGGSNLTPADFNCGTCRTAADAVKLPIGATGPVFFGNLQAPGTVVLISVGDGAITGTVNVLDLGINGSGGTADLFGFIGGVGGPSAAQRGVHTPHADNAHRLNNCAIGSPNCIALPPVVPVVQTPINALDFFEAQAPSEPIDIDRLNTGNEDSL